MNNVAEEVEDKKDQSSEISSHWLANGTTSWVALFAGQGYNAFTELAQLYDSSNASLVEFVSNFAKEIIRELQSEEVKNAGCNLSHGFNLVEWLENPDICPDDWYLYSAPIAYPLITLTQIVRYLKVLEQLRSTHSLVLGERCKAAVGHSQGIVSAILLSMSASNEELIANTIKCARYLLYQGLRCSETIKELSVTTTAEVIYEEKGSSKDVEPIRSPMLSIDGLTYSELVDFISTFINLEKKKAEEKRSLSRRDISFTDINAEIEIALINGPKQIVVCGHPVDLFNMKSELLATFIDADAKNNVPFNKRKPKVVAKFLKVGAPFHSNINKLAAEKILNDCKRIGFSLDSVSLAISVYDTSTGKDLMPNTSDGQLTKRIILMQTVETMNFVRTLENIERSKIEVNHIIDFGPGIGTGMLCANLKVGSGLLTVSAAAHKGTKVPSFVALLDCLDSMPIHGSNWSSFKPALVERTCDKKIFVETKFTRVTGKPPVMMSGMTPCTSLNGIDFVAACSNGGFHCELAAGGLPRPKIFIAKIMELVTKLDRGIGITINMLYLNPRQWEFQFPLTLDLARKGVPIESITIGAGIPSLEKAAEIIESLLAVGIFYMSLKPGTSQGIHDVLSIAKSNPQMTILLQWTGGRGGGHHSYEDFHSPLFETYPYIREIKNVVLVVGSGFGDSSDSIRYIDGTWATLPPFSRTHPMPVDCILLGSRCMVAKEAPTAEEVKKLITETPGVDEDSEWTKTYESDAGGILSVKSELGEQIHMIANRGARCWRDFERLYFSNLDKYSRREAVLKDKWTIIRRLNNDFQKVFFGRTSRGDVVELEDMTYFDMLKRMVDLMSKKHKNENGVIRYIWFDPSYRKRTLEMINRAERRFFPMSAINQPTQTSFDIIAFDKDPSSHIDFLSDIYPEMKCTTLAEEDISYFVHICGGREYGKPVNFVPIIDEELERWFKKDSLWYSEDLDAVPNRDAQRVCILHGPMAAKYSRRTDEGICSILGNIHEDYINQFQKNSSKVKRVELFGHLNTTQEETIRQENSWFDVCLHCTRASLRDRIVKNPISLLLNRCDNFSIDKNDKTSVAVGIQNGEEAVKIEFYQEKDLLKLTVVDENPAGENLSLWFEYKPQNFYCPVRFVTEGSNSEELSIKQYYKKIWQCFENPTIKTTFSDSVSLSYENLASFKNAVSCTNSDKEYVPIDIANVLCWRPLATALVCTNISGSLLNLVHLSNKYEVFQNGSENKNSLKVGDRIDSEITLTAVTIIPQLGKKIEISGILVREAIPWMRLQSEFLIRNIEENYSDTFERRTYEAQVKISDKTVATELSSKDWLKLDNELQVGALVSFRLNICNRKWMNNKMWSEVEVSGTAWQAETVEGDLSRLRSKFVKQIGTIYLFKENVKQNPVVQYLDAIKTKLHETYFFETGGYILSKMPFVVVAPKESRTYAMASMDQNPIHRNQNICILAGLPDDSTIVHGMWTSATARNLLEDKILGNEPYRIHKYHVEFVGMVHHEDELAISFKHIGMQSGRMLIDIDVRNVKLRNKVMKARAEAEQPRTAYLFTGQGSAIVGMGMDRYATVPVAKEVWDRADLYLRSNYGFSILEIVRNNPKELIIHFGGRRGKKIRENYRALVNEQNEQLITAIGPYTKSFTFRAPDGLLFATQFAQPALVLVQKAAFEELIHKGMVPDSSLFAGHSLGEYAALASYADVLSIEDLVDTVFKRGIVMQNAVPRDSRGKSEYGMVAVNPSRVNAHFTPEMLQIVVHNLDALSGSGLIQIVNFNIYRQQYVVAGELYMLDALAKALNILAKDFNSDLEVVASQAFESAVIKKQLCTSRESSFHLEKGVATIPLPGIDVPFHSRMLLDGVPAFRKLLEPKLKLKNIEQVMDLLVGKYIPNVLAEPFEISEAYFKKIFSATGSAILRDCLNRFSQFSSGEKARILLMELLAHQFAMPVQWIATQNVIFQQRIKRIIELGPSPVLKGMAHKSLTSGLYGREYKPNIMWWKEDMDLIMFQHENFGLTFEEFFQTTSDLDDLDDSIAPRAEVKECVNDFRQPETITLELESKTSVSYEDFSISKMHALRVLLASKLQKPLQDIKETVTLAELAQGRSAIQNEMIGEITREFNIKEEIRPESKLGELSHNMPPYDRLGPILMPSWNKLTRTKFPGGVTDRDAQSFLESSFGLSPKSSESIFLHALSMPPKTRLNSKIEVDTWLSSVCQSFAKDQGHSLVHRTQPVPVEGSVVSMEQSRAQSKTQLVDESISPNHALAIFLAMKLDRPLPEINDSTILRDMSSGKSALLNEIIADMSSEFSFSTEINGDMTVSEIKSKIINYTGIGKFFTSAINRMIQNKFPGGYGRKEISMYLMHERGFGIKTIDAVLTHALLHVPKDRIADELKAKKFLDSVSKSYCDHVGLNWAAICDQPTFAATVQKVSLNRDNDLLHQLLNRQLEVYQELLEKNGDGVQRAFHESQNLLQSANRRLDEAYAELGEEFFVFAQAQFDPLKVRSYESYWNWVVQDALDLHLYVLDAVRISKGETIKSMNTNNPHFLEMAEWITATKEKLSYSPPQAWFRNFLCNRATPELLTNVKYFAKAMLQRGYDEYAQSISLLAEQVAEWIHRAPVHVAIFASLEPRAVVNDEKLVVDYQEVQRKDTPDAVAYVNEMSRGLFYQKRNQAEVTNPSQSLTLTTDISLTLDEAETTITDTVSQMRRPRSETELSVAIRDITGLPSGPRLEALRKTIAQPDIFEYDSIHVHKRVPYIHLKSPSKVDKAVRILDEPLTSEYLSCLHDIAATGISFSSQVALVTGAGLDSIATEVVKALLEGGATVLVTIRLSRGDDEMVMTHKRFRKLYEEFGSKGSRLITIPCNCASSQDIHNLIQHIYVKLKLDLDFIIPFAAVTETGVDISNISAKSEAIHRMMLINLIRLLGCVKREKEIRQIYTRPAMVVLPCSPNHGEFGYDGLYAESKLGCEALFNKWKSEGWSDFLSIAAAVIGWTRSALMSQNNSVAEGVEKLGMRTFSTKETAFNLIGLLHPSMVTNASCAPLWADLTGNWTGISDLKEAVASIRAELNLKLVQAKYRSEYASSLVAIRETDELKAPIRKSSRLANPNKTFSPFPNKPSVERMEALQYLQNMVNLQKVVVCVGYGETGPWGNARTRWEMEAFGEFSLEGCIELAWLLGYIKHHEGYLKSDHTRYYIGWVDSSTGEPVQDDQVKLLYEKTITAHCGIRLIEPDLFEGYDPNKKSMLRQVAIDKSLPPIRLSSVEEAEEYKTELGSEFVRILQRDGEIYMQLLKGATISIPRAMRFNRHVAGQIPTGWDPIRLGIPKDIVQSVDPVTLYVLVSTVESLICSGLTDPYELYSYVHVSEVGNTSGGGMGGMRSLKRMFYDRKLDGDIPSDTLAESFINTMPAWINMLLLSSSGPIKTPVGACATAAESVEIGVETILSGKARVVITGGYDDFGETGSFEFAQMGATNSTDDENAAGRFPFEASRPMTKSRHGFVEAHGSGTQVLMDAELAIEMGVPIYAIIALTNTATDKNGRSIPAPGKGILTTAREIRDDTGEAELLLSFEFRANNIRRELQEIEDWAERKMKEIQSKGESRRLTDGEEAANRYIQLHSSILEKQRIKKTKVVYDVWSNDFFRGNPSIAPLRGALAVWGLTIDDIAVGSFHGTSTELNDTNESHVVNTQLKHLGRADGNILCVIAQKYLTGHPKGAAAAWMLNGLVQCMITGKVPGNRNLDNVDDTLRRNNYLFYPNRTINLPRIDAAFLKSFGFGQAGAEIMIIHPDYCVAVLEEEKRKSYFAKRDLREKNVYRYQQRVLSGKVSFVQVKNHAPYTEKNEETVYLNPTARTKFSESKNEWSFVFHDVSDEPNASRAKDDSNSSLPSKKPHLSAEIRLQVVAEEVASGLRNVSDRGIGIDIEPISTFIDFKEKRNFINNNFTKEEQLYCENSPNPPASYSGRWAAKEAVIKAISSVSNSATNIWKGPGSALKEIEVLVSPSGAPDIKLSGYAEEVFKSLALNEVKLSISHTAEIAIAQAVVR